MVPIPGDWWSPQVGGSVDTGADLGVRSAAFPDLRREAGESSDTDVTLHRPIVRTAALQSVVVTPRLMAPPNPARTEQVGAHTGDVRTARFVLQVSGRAARYTGSFEPVG